jgi:ATP-dependent RNA helicase HelY
VLVSAPTGSGKTVVAEHAVALALRDGGRCFYTAPIKALSNQKYHDLCAAIGSEQVGLLTGDHAINSGAPIVVMTTEVLRNMVYARSAALDGLHWVVLDEVHFLADAYRGPVWEEVLIHTPLDVRFVCLSATVSNAVELGEWIAELRGPTDTVLEHRRPIELDPLLFVGDRSSEREHLVPLVVNGHPNPEGHRFDADRPTTRGGSRPRTRSRFFTPRRVDTIERLAADDLLPAIYFIFSRNGCEEAASQ